MNAYQRRHLRFLVKQAIKYMVATMILRHYYFRRLIMGSLKWTDGKPKQVVMEKVYVNKKEGINPNLMPSLILYP